jgi:hypothetical protein
VLVHGKKLEINFGRRFRRDFVHGLHRFSQIIRRTKEQTSTFKNLCKSAKSVDQMLNLDWHDLVSVTSFFRRESHFDFLTIRGRCFHPCRSG